MPFTLGNMHSFTFWLLSYPFFPALEFLLGFSVQVLAFRQVRCALKVFLNLALLCIHLTTWDPIVKPWNVCLITLSCVRVRTNRVKIKILKQLRADIQAGRHCDLTSRSAPVRYVILSDCYPPWHPLIEKIHTNKCRKKKHGIRIWHVLLPTHTHTKLQPFFSLCHYFLGTAK